MRLFPQTFAGAVYNVCIRGCKRYPWRTHVFAFKVDQIGPGGCSALQGWLQCTAGAVAVHCIRPCSALPLFPQVRATVPASTCNHPRKYVNPFPPCFSTEPIYRLNLNTDNLVFQVKSNEVSSHDGTSLKLILVSKVKRLFVRITVANYVKIYNVAKYSAMFLNTF